MQIICLGNKCGGFLWRLLLGLVITGHAFATPSLLSSGTVDRLARIEMTDGSAYSVKLFSDVGGILYSKDTHGLNGDSYIALFQVSASNPGKPTGYCGSGSEVWLYVYKVQGAELIAQTRVLVSSCLRSISMASQNSGKEAQDFDFSSMQWNATGFSIEWFDKVDSAGRQLSSTNYVLHDGIFSPLDVLNHDTRGE